MPKAFPRSFTGKTVLKSAMEFPAIMAAATPCKNLVAIKAVRDGDSPQIADVNVNSATPTA